MQAVENAKENPYVAVVARKHRNLKKKMEKIVKFEAQLASGKVLDEEQLALVHSKKTVEKSLTDIAAIRAQLEEVAKEQESAVVEHHIHKHTVTTTEEIKTEVEVDKNTVTTNEDVVDVVEEVAVHNKEEVSDFHMKVVQYAVSTMTETDVDEVVTGPAAVVVDFKPQLEAGLGKLLKVLHVYQRYKDITSRPLPENVDFFGKTLLGMTSISSFNDTLASSLRSANNYVNDDSNVFVRGVTYAQMSDVIDQLAEEMEKCHVRGGPGSLTALLRSAVVPPQPEPVAPVVQPEPEVVVVEEEEEEESQSIEITNLQIQFGEGIVLDEVPEELIQSVVRTDVDVPTFGLMESASVPVVAEVNITVPVDSESTGFVLSLEEEIEAPVEGDKPASTGKPRNNNKGDRPRRNNNRKERAVDGEAKQAVEEPKEGENNKAKKEKKFNNKKFNKEGEESKTDNKTEEAAEGKVFKKKNFKNERKNKGDEGKKEVEEDKPAAPPAPKSWKDIAKATTPATEATPAAPAATPAPPAAPVAVSAPVENKEEAKKPVKEFRAKKTAENNNEENNVEQGQKFNRNNGEKKFYRKDGDNNKDRPHKNFDKDNKPKGKPEIVADLDDGFEQPRRHQSKPKPTENNNGDNKPRNFNNKDGSSRPFKPRSVALAPKTEAK